MRPLRPGGRGVHAGPGGRALVVTIGIALATAACSGGQEQAAPIAPTIAPTPSTTSATAPPSTTAAPSLLDAADPALAARLDPLWRDVGDGCVTVARDGAVRYERGAGRALPPASAIKVVTAAAVLDGLGAATSLRTTVRAIKGPVDGVVAGDIWLVGGGDPVLGSDAWASAELDPDEPRTSLDALADATVAAGVRRVEGRVLGDESRYDAERFVRTWPRRLIADGESGPLSALLVNDGFEVWGHPGVPFDDPPAGAARLFTDLLAERGVSVAGSAAPGVAPPGAVDLAALESPPVGRLVEAMLRDSDNETAELLVKELAVRRTGGPGSTSTGSAEVVATLRRAGITVDGEVVADGSGLSSATSVACRTLVATLDRWSGVLRDRLAVAGRSGTLERRFVGTPVEGRLRAKTGSLDGVLALAGFVDDGYAFAIILTGDTAAARVAQERLVSALATG